MLTSPKLRWTLLFAVLIGLTVLLRFGRSPVLALIVIVAVAVLWTAAVIRARMRSSDAAPRPMKNVTPVEPAIAPPAGRPFIDVTPAVVVAEPQDATDLLAAKLQALDRLRADGLLTDDEYEAKRAQLIADL